MTDFQRDLTSVINRHCQEFPGNIPDFIIAEYLVDCLKNLHETTMKRERWFGRDNSFSTTIATDD